MLATFMDDTVMGFCCNTAIISSIIYYFAWISQDQQYSTDKQVRVQRVKH